MTKTRECGTKQKHPSKAAAENHKFGLVRSRGARPSSYQTYRCPHCGSWHIGHKKRRRR